VLAVEWSNVHLAGAFLIGMIFGTVATLRIVRFVTDYFGGVDRRARRRPPGHADDECPGR
jgi:hypothetical protein